jgi:biopolymer transport protein ExbB/TolQ
MRSAGLVHRDLKRGLNSLATIVSTAPWLGLVGTLVGMHYAFPSLGAEKTAAMAIYFDLLSQALAPCALGVMVAVVTMGFYRYLLTRLDTFDMEMETASLQLVNTLSHL